MVFYTRFEKQYKGGTMFKGVVATIVHDDFHNIHLELENISLC